MPIITFAAVWLSSVACADPFPARFAQTIAKASRQFNEASLTPKQKQSILREIIPIGPNLEPKSDTLQDWIQLVGLHALRSPEFLDECLRGDTLGRAIGDAMLDFETAKTLLTLDPAFASFLDWVTLLADGRGEKWFAEWVATLGDVVEPAVYWILTEGLSKKRISPGTWDHLSSGASLLSTYHQTFPASPRIMAWARNQFNLALDPPPTGFISRFFTRSKSSLDLLRQEHLAVYLLKHANDFGMQLEVQNAVSAWLSQNYQPILDRDTGRILEHFEQSVDKLSAETIANLTQLFLRFAPGHYRRFNSLRMRLREHEPCGSRLVSNQPE